MLLVSSPGYLNNVQKTLPSPVKTPQLQGITLFCETKLVKKTCEDDSRITPTHAEPRNMLVKPDQKAPADAV